MGLGVGYAFYSCMVESLRPRTEQALNSQQINERFSSLYKTTSHLKVQVSNFLNYKKTIIIIFFITKVKDVALEIVGAID